MLRFKTITVWMAAGVLALSLINAGPAFAWGQKQGEAGRAKNQGPAQYPGRQQRPGMERPGRHAGQWLSAHRGMSPEQQRKALENDPRFRNLPPQQQERYREQLDRFNHLSPQQQERVINRMETWEHLTPEQKGEVRQLHQQMQQLPPERRQAVRNAVESLRAMPPEARQRAIESDDYKKRFTPEERNILDGASKLPLAPAEPSERGPEE